MDSKHKLAQLWSMGEQASIFSTRKVVIQGWELIRCYQRDFMKIEIFLGVFVENTGISRLGVDDN